jgi:drug/metabolite transporter (DMT)-like permease
MGRLAAPRGVGYPDRMTRPEPGAAGWRGAAASPAWRAATALVLSAAVFQAMGAVVKLLGDTYPTGQIVFFRGLFATLVLVALVPGEGGLRILRPARPLGLLLRSLAGLTAMILIFAALPLLPLADAAAIGFTAPLLTTALAGPLLGERVGRRRWLAVAAGFVGVVIVLRPGTGVLGTGALLALAGAFFGALAMLAIRHLGQAERGVTVAFWYSLLTAAVGAATLPFAAVWPGPMDLALLVAVGLLGGVGQILLTQAYRSAAASFVAPFEYTAILWSILLGLAIWGDWPDAAVLVGSALVVAAGLALLRERAAADQSSSRAP